MKNLLFAATAAMALLAPSCKHTATEASAETTAAFATDSIHWADSLKMGDCNGKAEISVAWPSEGKQVTLDSIRHWIAWQIFTRYDERSEEIPTSENLADGNKLVTLAGNDLMQLCRKDFEGFQEVKVYDGISYEFSYQVFPDYSTEEVVTYLSNRYSYMAGAHGSFISMGQTFVLADGEGLDATNIFRPDAMGEVLALVKQQVFEQYFKDEASGADNPSSLADCLLIPESEMQLPQCPPYFEKDGVVFLYQQYEIAAYALGMPACKIPYSTLRPYFSRRALDLLGMKQ